MANTGFIIHPSVVQVFTSGPNSGSVVSSSFNETFNEGSGYTSASICGDEFVYKEEDFENCVVVDECPIPNFLSLSAYDCSNNNADPIFNLMVGLSNEATTLFVEYSTQSTFSKNVGTFSKPANSSQIFQVNISDLPILPISRTSPIYFRCYFDCGGGNTSAYSITKSATCPPPEDPATVTTNSSSETSCYSCAGVTINIPTGVTRTVKISKTGIADYAPGACSGVNQVSNDITESISNSKTYSLGLDAQKGSNNNYTSRVTVQVLKGNVVEDSYILTRQHMANSCNDILAVSFRTSKNSYDSTGARYMSLDTTRYYRSDEGLKVGSTIYDDSALTKKTDGHNRFFKISGGLIKVTSNGVVTERNTLT